MVESLAAREYRLPDPPLCWPPCVGGVVVKGAVTPAQEVE